jgi:hypothetical protein
MRPLSKISVALLRAYTYVQVKKGSSSLRLIQFNRRTSGGPAFEPARLVPRKQPTSHSPLSRSPSLTCSPCLSRRLRRHTVSTSSRFTSACSRTSKTGLLAMISSAGVHLPSVLSLSATGVLRITHHRSPESLCTIFSNVHDPRALAVILEKAEAELAAKQHPDPYIRASLLASYFYKILTELPTTSSGLPRWHQMVSVLFQYCSTYTDLQLLHCSGNATFRYVYFTLPI